MGGRVAGIAWKGNPALAFARCLRDTRKGKDSLMALTTRPRLAAALAIAALSALAACSPKAQNETAEAAEAIGADANATMSEAVSDVDAAADRAIGGADNAIDATGNADRKSVV